ncbi:MAG: hypothetical protein ACK4F0_01510 [Candidatus Ratteibacteria bacterium]
MSGKLSPSVVVVIYNKDGSKVESRPKKVNVTVVKVKGIAGPKYAVLKETTNSSPKYLTDELKYTVKTDPENTECSGIKWEVIEEETSNSCNGTLNLYYSVYNSREKNYKSYLWRKSCKNRYICFSAKPCYSKHR